MKELFGLSDIGSQVIFCQSYFKYSYTLFFALVFLINTMVIGDEGCGLIKVIGFVGTVLKCTTFVRYEDNFL